MYVGARKSIETNVKEEKEEEEGASRRIIIRMKSKTFLCHVLKKLGSHSME